MFQYTPESEAPAELAFYLPAQKAYCGAEIVNRTMHNLYTLRGAKVRDALKWSGYIDDAIQRFADVEVVFTSHNWPMLRARALARVPEGPARHVPLHPRPDAAAREPGRDAARDRRAARAAAAAREELRQPRLLRNAAAQREGGLPVLLRLVRRATRRTSNPLPPVELGAKYVEAIGGAAALKEKARAALAARRLPLGRDAARPPRVRGRRATREARELLARAYDQLGYQAESGVWRSVYLTGANELRHGVPKLAGSTRASRATILARIPLDLFFAAMATRVTARRPRSRSR